MGHEAFRRAILNDRADDAARLVYADWLQGEGMDAGQGDEARAEFIRVQVRLNNTGLHKAERKALLAREKALLDANRERWLDEDLAHVPPAQMEGMQRGLLTFTRGFADVMTMTDAERDVIRQMHVPGMPPGEMFAQLVEQREHTLPGQNHSAGITVPELKTLIAAGLDANAELPMMHGQPIFAVLDYFGKDARLPSLQLLADAGANLNARSSDREFATPLHFIASERPKFIPEARLLVRNGASTRLKDENDLTVRAYIEEADGPKSKLLAAINDEERETRKQKPLSDKIPRKGSGFRRGRAGGDANPPQES
ncbi:MAG: TIGR02996 domain-containing protein [Proteobacteria bacterium]|nr:TIGR02996 domain-containing protein [Pseudomonadota bacterium]